MKQLWWLLGICAGMTALAGLPHGALAAPAVPLPTVSVLSYGAVGDGTTPDTAAVQKAIDQCSANRAAIIDFPTGRYVVGTIILKDNVRLRLEDGATLLGSGDAGDYHALAPSPTAPGRSSATA